MCLIFNMAGSLSVGCMARQLCREVSRIPTRSHGAVARVARFRGGSPFVIVRAITGRILRDVREKNGETSHEDESGGGSWCRDMAQCRTAHERRGAGAG